MQQGTTDHVLYVCAQGTIRSRTAEVPLRGGIEARSCGADPDALVPVTRTLASWAHLIVCMEPEQRRCVSEFIESEGKGIICLELQDIYRPFQPALAFDPVARLDGQRWLTEALPAAEMVYRRAISAAKKRERM